MDSRLASTAERLSGLIPNLWQGLGDELDLAAGGLASLMLAEPLQNFHRTEPLPPKYYEKLSSRVQRMTAGTLPPHGLWITGYYLNSAIFRIGAAREKIRMVLRTLRKRGWQAGTGPDSLLPDSDFDKLHTEYTDLKHRWGGLVAGRTVSYDQAVMALQELIEAFEALKGEGPLLAEEALRWVKEKPRKTGRRKHK